MANSKKNAKKKMTKSAKISKKAIRGKTAKQTCKKVIMAIGFIVFPLIVGVISSLITGDAMTSFGKFNQPPLAPPAWLFPVAWTILYILMGVASYLIFRIKPKTQKEERFRDIELTIYFTQLIFNFLWTIFFFKFELRFFAFGWLVVMWLMILTLIIMAFRNKKAAAWCLIPYLLWCTFAAYLNIMIAVLN